MIEICLNTDVFTRYPLPEALALAARAGYRSIDLNAIPSWEPHLDLDAADAATRLAELPGLLSDYGLALAVAETSANLTAWDDRERGHALDYCRRAMAAFAPLGGEILCLSAPGTNLFGVAEQQRMLVDSLRSLAPGAAHHGVTLVLEIYPGSCLERTTDAMRVLEAVDSPDVGFNLCIPHTAALGENLLEAYTIGRKRLRHVHIADTPSSTVNHQHLVPGDGTVDFLPLFRALAHDGYSGYITVQIYSCVDTAFESAVRALSATRRLLGEAGAW
jgi:sugar phosphate isomerase/epimerase